MREALPPYDQDAEEAVLGSCLIDDEAIGMIDLEPSDFFSEQNQLVYDAMCNICAYTAVNQITVAHELANKGKLDDIGGGAYLSHLVACCPTSLHVVHYASIVKKCSFSRRLISAAGQIESIGYKNEDPAVAGEKTQAVVKRVLSTVQDNCILSPEDVANSAFGYYSDTSKQIYLPTGINNLDRQIGGYLQGEYVIWAARAGTGKTTILDQQSCHIAVEDPVLFFSLEMSKQQVINKSVARITGFPEEWISLKSVPVMDKEGKTVVKRRNFNQEELDKIYKAVDEISKLKRYIVEGNRTTESIRQIVSRQKDTIGCSIVFIDYLSLLRDRVSRDENIRIGLMSKELAGQAKEFKIPYAVAHQFNRDVEHRESKEPRLSDLRQAGEEDADLVLSPYRNPDNAYQVDIYNLKDRLRGLGGKVFAIGWQYGKYW